MAARRFLVLFVAGAVAMAAGVLGVTAALDPFDRGQGLITRAGTIQSGPRTANVSRGRDPNFNAAIFGNSHVQLLHPERLGAATGDRFVQLTVPGTRPREQLAVLDWFLANHRGTARAIVMGMDHYWCSSDPRQPADHPFPYWLYETRFVDYLAGLFRLQAVRVVPARIGYLFGRGKARRADGYWDYEVYRTRDPAYLARTIADFRKQMHWNGSGPYPWLDQLAQRLAALPAEVRVALVIPPVHADALPVAGTAQSVAERGCSAAVQRIASQRAGTTFVDARGDIRRWPDPSRFWDVSHFDRVVAEDIERDVAAGLSGARR